MSDAIILSMDARLVVGGGGSRKAVQQAGGQVRNKGGGQVWTIWQIRDKWWDTIASPTWRTPYSVINFLLRDKLQQSQ